LAISTLALRLAIFRPRLNAVMVLLAPPLWLNKQMILAMAAPGDRTQESK
jgi:hypothetical protein